MTEVLEDEELLLAGHFCRAGDEARSDARSIIQSIVYQASGGAAGVASALRLPYLSRPMAGPVPCTGGVAHPRGAFAHLRPGDGGGGARGDGHGTVQEVRLMWSRDSIMY